MRKLIAGTGWKMNIGAAEAARYAARLLSCLDAASRDLLDLFVLPPFTSLHAAHAAFLSSPVGIGAQNMHWEASGAWTGEISAAMLAEAGCKYVELAHSERLQHFGETYEFVRRKLNAAMDSRLTPILCLGETRQDKSLGRADDVLAEQIGIALADQSASSLPAIMLAYEPRWAIGAANAAPPDYVAERHRALRSVVRQRYGAQAAGDVRIIYGGSVTPGNSEALMDHPDVDGLFVGRAAWSPEGFAEIAAIVARAAMKRKLS
ncbi:triose-phosphate isomerase [Methylocapsa sp. S129]|uniref:triose-phosphate isomerase n=1 Tax=Methylocapsa sp. S129 TaxID=1641869 RepID=UPI00131CEA43|nr:triose-phosphate isomerase [Methylocapsa sp. S129]